MFIGFSDSSHLGKADHEVPIGYVSEYDLKNVVEKLYAEYGDIFPFNKQVSVSIRRPQRPPYSTFLMFMTFFAESNKTTLCLYCLFVFVFLHGRCFFVLKGPDQQQIFKEGNDYIRREFPMLDSLQSCT
jgi:hypothetical protein